MISWLSRFRRDISGVAAVEAALLLPLLVLTSLGAIELAAALDARRSVDNASFSLVQSAAASSVVDRGRRARWVAGHDQSFNDVPGLSGVRAELRSYVNKAGTISRAWEWSPNGSGPGLSDGEAVQEVQDQIVPGEGILVAVVEARYRPIIAGFVIGNMTFRSIHTQVPLKKTIPLYR
jgi:Flp pilus assembly protein TadG